MPTYQKCDKSVTALVNEILSEHSTHQPTIDAGVKIDLLFAFPAYDETTGKPIGDAIKSRGCKCLGLCRIVSLKDRSKELGDVEITIDGEWWKTADIYEKKALLDHELHHIVATERTDDLGRPIIKMRKHDVEFGWFAVIASRHGSHSQEQKQAKSMMDIYGQFFWPSISRESKGRITSMDVHQTVGVRP